jgi:general secretion pathway protein A
MYTAFYGLREKPFSLTPNPRFLFLADAHREAMAHLFYGLEQGEGFIVISGEVGTGKTTLCRSMLERLDTDTEVAILFNPSHNAIELLQSINEEFGLPAESISRRELLSRLNRFLLEKKRAGKRVVLIVDEAQNLSPGTLEQVRLLSNLETASAKLIQIILLGQPELDAKLDSNELRQLRQRVSVRWRLDALPQADTYGYVQHRLRIAAGAEREIFSESALREIHRRTSGVPRLINVLCDRTLLAGYAEQAHRIGPRIVQRAAREVPDALGEKHPRRAYAQPAVWAVAAALLAGFFWLGWNQGAGFDWLGAPGGAASTGSLPDVAGARALLGGNADGNGRRSGSDLEGSATLEPETALAARASLAPAAPPLREDEAHFGMPSEIDAQANDTLGNLDDTLPSRGDFLAALLTGQSDAMAMDVALDSVLDAFGLEPLAEPATSLEGGLASLGLAGLSFVRLTETNLETLQRFDYPALLRLRTGDGETRIVALLRLDDEVAELLGVVSSGPLRVPTAALLEQWDGGAVVVWRALQSLPEAVALGDSGASVLWIQEALTRLGLLSEGITGDYDAATLEAVRRFQRSRSLIPDGVTGPMTQMLIYSALAEPDRPSLAGRETG